MGEVIAAVMLLGLPFVFFVWTKWRREEEERRRRLDDPKAPDPPPPGPDSYWGGTGRPGR